MPLFLTLRSEPTAPLAIDVEGILPERLATLEAEQITRLPIRVDGRARPLGDLFAVSGSAADGVMVCQGDFSRVHRLGAGMRSGRIEATGDVGRHAGEGMTGGTLAIGGSAGDWLAAGMAGGEVAVAGGAGDNTAAALPGEACGMRGGIVIVAGGVGCLAGARMRRGVLAIGGDCGEAAAFEMRAGTVLVAGRVGPHAANGMRRGSLVALGAAPTVPPLFRRGGIWQPAFLPLLVRRLRQAGFTAAGDVDGRGRWQQWHGDPLCGGRGEIICRPLA